MCLQDGKIFFLYSAENTWEPEDNLDCPELIEEFLRNTHLSEGNEEERSEPLEPGVIPKEEMTEQETEIVSMPEMHWLKCLEMHVVSMLFTELLHLKLYKGEKKNWDVLLLQCFRLIQQHFSNKKEIGIK